MSCIDYRFLYFIAAKLIKLLGDEKISKEELKKLLLESEGLALIKGKWIEIDKDKLKEVLKAYEKADLLAKSDGLTIADAMRMELNAGEKLGINESFVNLEVSNGTWLKKIRETMKKPDILKENTPSEGFKASLRPYQKTGFSWLTYMQKLGFGACLADDMGLGKTVQIIAFLEKIRVESGGKALIIIPASLIGNWQKEIEKFAPDMKITILHGKETVIDLDKEDSPFLYITTYGMAVRLEEIRNIVWDVLILDEAQAIKNPGTKQTKTIKMIKAKTKIAMTEPISAFLERVFNRKGLVLHGGTSVKKRSEIVEAFNGEEYIPYMVLSLKAGGVGLNLTSANHVIHFDRWWNPAVENKATDRAFRIGQTKNVMVHRFVTKGTIEEKIDLMIEEKQVQIYHL